MDEAVGCYIEIMRVARDMHLMPKRLGLDCPLSEDIPAGEDLE